VHELLCWGMLIFESGFLADEDQLVGKTIAKVTTVPDDASAIGELEGWTIEFTDGDKIRLKASYDDSCVQLVEP